jgi:hypothetical protein
MGLFEAGEKKRMIVNNIKIHCKGVEDGIRKCTEKAIE